MSRKTNSFDEAMTRKLLRLLASLRRTESGSVLFHQVERLLDDLTRHHHESEDVQLDVIQLMLEPLARQLPEGSSLQVELKLLQSRMRPPVTSADLDALHTFLDLYSGQFSSAGQQDASALKDAIEPLLQVEGNDTVPQQSIPIEPLVIPDVPSVPDSVEDRTRTELETAEAELIQAVEPVNANPAPKGKQSQQATDAGDSEQGVQSASFSPHSDDADSSISTGEGESKAHHSITEMPSGLAQKVLDTISRNQEFGVLLEVVENELRQAEQKDDIENLRWTIIRQIEKLAREHQRLASNLDGTQQYLKMVETDSRQLSDELSRVRLLSLTDELTGLPNRRAFLRRLEDEVARVQRYGFPLSMALIDLDKFKAVNDRYGHAGGDEVLRIYSKNVLSVFRHHDLVARYGGEEFAVLLANTSADGATRALNKVMKRASETRWQSNQQTIPVPTFSAGLAFYKPGETTSRFIERVDQALYRAKRLGRNRVELDDTYAQGAEVVMPRARSEKSNPGRDS